jgi:hypothetical protein
MVVIMASSASADIVLKVDFSSLTQDGGPHNQEGWSAYSAGHEVAADFITANYSGITVTPAWPNTTDNRVQQSIDRGAGNDDNWNDAAGDLDLVTDWIGIDTRTGNGGNGNWDGTSGTPTYMTLTLGGLSAGVYEWTSFHHDTEHCHGPFAVWLSTDGGATFTQLDDGIMTDSTPGGTPDSGAVEGGPDAYTLVSTYRTSFTANGMDDVVMRFAPYSDAAGVHRQIWGMNGFELMAVSSDLAFGPNPINGATDVEKSVILSWSPGESTATTNGHKIFLSNNFADVNEGLATAERGVLSNPVFDTAVLDFALEYDTTYYWRVDQASTPGGPWNPGEIWSFTVESYSIAIPGTSITATADSNDADQGPENTVNGSGLDADDLHSVELTDMWLSASGAPEPAWIEYQFDKVYKLHQILVWNYNGQSILTGFGLQNVTIKYSTDGINYQTLGDTHEFPKGTGSDDYSPDAPIDFDGVAAMYVRITANSNWGGDMYTQYGLSEVRFYYIPVRARQPNPASEATDTDVDNVTLSWRAGRGAASHELYLSTDEQAVMDETISPGDISDGSGYASYDAGELDLDQTYYWKVNEVNNADIPSIWEGDLWNFTTREFLIVDDFESYDAVDKQIWAIWHEGIGYYDLDGVFHPGNGTGSGVGDETTDSYTEETIVRPGGSQSMPYFYDNNKPDKLKYSEAELTLSPGQDLTDWTKHGVKALSLWFQGDPNNTPEQMYVKINDAKVTYKGDINNIKRALWFEWNIELGEFTGVDLQNVTKICIGFGDDTNPTPGGAGVVYFDDIRLYPARCIPELLRPGADLNDDCVVDLLDVEIIANQWLSSGLLVTPQPPTTSGLVAHYEFEDNADDSVGVRHGVTTGGPTYVAGVMGQAIHFDGLNDYLFIDGSFQLPEYTMAVWFRCEGGTDDERDILSAYATGVQHGILLEITASNVLRYLHRCTDIRWVVAEEAIFTLPLRITMVHGITRP